MFKEHFAVILFNLKNELIFDIFIIIKDKFYLKRNNHFMLIVL